MTPKRYTPDELATMWRVVRLRGGPRDGEMICIRGREIEWRGVARTMPGPDERILGPPEGGVYVLKDSGTEMEWFPQPARSAEEEEWFAQIHVATYRVADHVRVGQRSGAVECPRCGGSLRFGVASNDHVSAVCETPDCLRWYE